MTTVIWLFHALIARHMVRGHMVRDEMAREETPTPVHDILPAMTQTDVNDKSQTLETRGADIAARMQAAANRAGRAVQAVTLLAISKTQTGDTISQALELGYRHFGENRVQEAADKWPALKSAYGDVELHLVGPLQTNKVKEAVALFDVIQTLDREKLARKLAVHKDMDGFPALYVQVNTGDEPQKSGVKPSELAAFLGLCRDELGLQIAGLMCLPPVDEAAGPHFALLGKLAAAHDIAGLSMGMSGDFETAIGLGATHIRLGTALFGPRQNPVEAQA